MHLILEPETGRVQSAGIYAKPPADAVGVDALPEGNLMDYLYKSGEFVYDPLPTEETAATTEERLELLEKENAQLKEALEMLLSGETEENADG
jgi:hypothetical protein